MGDERWFFFHKLYILDFKVLLFYLLSLVSFFVQMFEVDDFLSEDTFL